jgi:hypothetical protein
VQNILQVHGKIPVTLVTKTPKKFEWILKRNNTESSSKDLETNEDKSTKRQETEVVDEEEEQELQEEVVPVDKESIVVVEVSSSEKVNNTEGQNETMSLTTDQSKHIDFVNQFRDIRKMSSKIRKKIIPKIFDQGGLHTRIIYVVDYEKVTLNITVMEPKQQNKVTKVLLISMQCFH